MWHCPSYYTRAAQTAGCRWKASHKANCICFPLAVATMQQANSHSFNISPTCVPGRLPNCLHEEGWLFGWQRCSWGPPPAPQSPAPRRSSALPALHRTAPAPRQQQPRLSQPPTTRLTSLTLYGREYKHHICRRHNYLDTDLAGKVAKNACR